MFTSFPVYRVSHTYPLVNARTESDKQNYMCREESMQQAHGYSFEKLAYKFGPWLTFGNLGVFLWGWRGHVPRTDKSGSLYA